MQAIPHSGCFFLQTCRGASVMHRFGLFCLMGCFVVACSTSQFNGTETRSSSEAKKDKTQYREDFDPATLGQDDFVVVPTPKTSSQDSTAIEPSDMNPEESSQEEGVQGFRVQLLATKIEDQAREEQRKAIFKFQERVYLDFESPYYKIRVGDCATRKEAETLRDKAGTLGFDNPWIVQSKINRKSRGQAPF
jgi:hypothetical protein